MVQNNGKNKKSEILKSCPQKVTYILKEYKIT